MRQYVLYCLYGTGTTYKIYSNKGLRQEGVRISTFYSAQYTQLELFLESEPDYSGLLFLRNSKGDLQTLKAGNGYYKWIKVSLEKNQYYDISIQQAHVSIAYLSGNRDIMDEGVCFLEFDHGVRKIQGAALSNFYDTPYREQYHFVPFKNWMNDPNGLCWYQGRYHLFYQANPHGQRWDNMYWGHAVSLDLVHWTHLPYVLQPQEDVLKNPHLKGGAFSGCAVPLESEVLFYFTRHAGPIEDCEKTLEWQTMMKSKDMLHFGIEKAIISNKPDGVGHDFRDPKVFRAKDKWYLILGANYNGNAAVLLYSSENLYTWSYENPLLIETDKRTTNIECPDFFELDGKYVAVGALMHHVDEHKRFQMTKYYIGRFENRKLRVEATGRYDFGSNFYAVQSFEHHGERIAVGWVSDFYGEHVEVPNGAYGSFTIPRILHIKNSLLCMEPVPQIYSLLDKQIYCGSGEDILQNNITGNSYYAKLKFSRSTDFKIILGKNKNSSIALERVRGITKIKTVGVKSEDVEFVADVNEVLKIEIFVDRRLVEVYLNQGSAVGTKVFYTDRKSGIFQATFQDHSAITKVEVYTMKSIW